MLSPKRNNILMVFLVLTIVLISLLGFNDYRIARKQIIESHEKSLSELSAAITTLIENHWIIPRERMVEILTSSSVLLSRIEGDAELQDLINEWMHYYYYHEDVFFIYYADISGRIEYYPTDGELPADYNPFDRPWYITGMNNPGEIVWTGPYVEAITGEIVLSTLKTIDDPITKEPLGVFSIDVSLTELTKTIRSIALPEGGDFYIVHEGGEIIASTSDNEQHIHFVKELLTEDNFSSPSSTYHKLNEEDFFVSISSFPNADWKQVLFVPRETMFSEIEPIKRNVFVALGVILILSIILFVMIFKELKKKVHLLADYFLQIGDGKGKTRELFKDKDEFHTLNVEFNKAIKETYKARERYRTIFENTGTATAIINKDASITLANSQAETLLGYSKEELENKSFMEFIFDQEQKDKIDGYLQQIEVSNSKPNSYELRMINRHGAAKDVFLTVTLIPGTDEKVVTMLDITAQKKTEEIIRKSAYHDPLTGLPNRKFFHERLTQELARAMRLNTQLAVMFLDLDDFKEVNDTFGHDAGDNMLCEVASRLREIKRESDIVSRLGGDEFTLLLTDINGPHEAGIVAERILQVFQKPVIISGNKIFIKASIGISIGTQDGTKPGTLLKKADDAMYLVKRKGKNNYRFYTS